MSSLKGMVLAAGLGTRLRPVTDLYAKPLIPFLGTTPLELALWRLKELGVQDVAVNSHYHADQIARVVGQRPLGFDLHLSHEPAILGTGGCYNPVKSWIGDSDLMVINGDVVSSVDVERLHLAHTESGAIATMALLPSVIPGESAVFFERGQVLGFGKTKPRESAEAGNFACVQILSRAFLELLPKTGSFDVISKGYEVALAQGHKVGAVVHEGTWHDIRNPAYYWLAVKDFLANEAKGEAVGIPVCRAARGLVTSRHGSALWDSTSVIGEGVTFGSSVMIEPGCQIGSGARLENCLLLPGAEVAKGAVEKNVILGKNLRVAL
jgi:mannose-1-phosphate guanylyltransferase